MFYRHPSALFHLFLCVMLVVTQILASINGRIVSAQQRGEQTGQSDIEKDVDELFKLLDQFESKIPHGPDQLEHWLERFSGDTLKAYSFVRDETTLVPYRGCLRGSRGVLMDRRGNSLDRSILLADFLRLSGKNVRLCHTTLSQQQTEVLLEQVIPAPTKKIANLQQQVSQQRESLFVKTCRDLNWELPETSKGDSKQIELLEKVTARSKQQTEQLIRIIGNDANDPLPEKRRQLQALQDHWWVEYENGQQWVALDSTNLQEKLKLKPDRQIKVDASRLVEQSVPADLHHRIEIRVVIEQWSEEKYQKHVALKHEIIPSQIIDQPIILYHVPRKWPTDVKLPQGADEHSKLLKTLASQAEWFPILAIGDHSISQKAFDDQGYLIEEAKPSIFGGLGEGLNRTAQSEGILTAEWIEYEMRVPGQPPRVEKREIFNLASAKSRRELVPPEWNDEKSNERSLTLSESIEMLPLVCNLDPNFVESRLLRMLLANREIVKYSLAVKPETPSNLQSLQEHSTPMNAAVLCFGLLRSQLLNQYPAAYVGSPNLITFHRRIKSIDAKQMLMSLGMDIVFNQLNTTTIGDDTRDAKIGFGVLDTNLEGMMLGSVDTTENTANIFAASAQQNIDWKLIRSMASLDGYGFSESTKAQMKSTLDSGYSIVIPAKPVEMDGDPVNAWWRVNLQTGETLGIGQRGWGQDLSETSVSNLSPAEIYAAKEWMVITTNACIFVQLAVYTLVGGFFGKMVFDDIVERINRNPSIEPIDLDKLESESKDE